MKRVFLFLVSVFIMTNLAWSSPVDSVEARNLALTFYRLHFPGQTLPVFEEISQSVGVNHFYIFNNVNGPGFVLVSGDDCAIPVLGYSGTSNCKGGELPDNILSWFGFYDGTIGTAVLNGEVATAEIAGQWNDLRAGSLPEPQSVTAVSPLLSTTWDQNAPYNNLCPGTGSNKAVVGCVATAMAQMMKFYNWPTTGTGSHSYVCNDGTYNYGTLSVNFGATTYDWANMINSYPNANSGTAAQRNAVATLMYHCGVAVEMVYTPNGSGAWTVGTSYPYYPSAETALKDYFNYSPSLFGAWKQYYTDAQWISMLKNDLDQQHPVIYGGSDQNGESGHCFVCDGYDNTNNFHFNWGWSGWYDGYYALSSLIPGTGGTGAGNGDFSYYQEAIFGAVPNNGSTPDPSGCAYLHYPLPGTLNFYTFNNNGGYVAGTNIYGETAKADYFTYSGSGTVESLNVTFGAMDGLNGSINFTVWADNNGTPGSVLGSKTVTLNTIYTTAINLSGNYECVFDNPIAVSGNFFAGIDFSNAGSAIGIYTNTAGDTVNTGWSLSSNGQWVPYSSPNHLGVSLTHAIHPYVCAATSPGPVTNTDLHVYSNYTYTPNPLQQNQSVSVGVSVANAGTSDFTGTIKLVLLNANNVEAQVIDQISGTLVTMTYAPLQYSGTVTVPAGTYQMAVFAQANGESTWTLVGQNYNYPNPITVTVTGGSTPPGPTGCNYLHYPLPTTTTYTVTGGGYVSGTNIYGDEAKADYFTYSGSGNVEKIKITMGAMDGTQGSVAFTVWADNNGTPGAVLGSKTVTLSTIYNAIGGGSGDYECVFDSPIAVTGNFFAGLDISNATSYFGLVSTTDGTSANTAWDYYDDDWWAYSDSWELSVTNAIFPYVCSGTDPNPPVNNPDLHVYSDFTYTPNPMQQNQAVSVEVSVANTGSAAFNGTLKLALLNANNTEVQVIGQSVITLSSMGFFNYQFSGTVTVPAGTYQMALYAQATGEATWTLVGTGLNYPNPVSVTVTGGSTPPVNEFNLIMYEDFSYSPNPMQQNQTVTVNTSVGNTGTGAFNGNFKLVLLTSSNTEAQVIGQQSGSINTMAYNSLQFSNTVSVMPGTYNLALYYQANGESTWTLVGSGFGHDNPVSVTVTGGSTPPVNDFNLVMYGDISFAPDPLQQNQTVTVNTSVGNTGTSAFNGNFKLVLLTSSNTEAQVIGQQSGSINTMAYNSLQFSNTVSVMPGTYNLALYYQATSESTWTLVGSGFGHDNPVSVTVTGGSTPPVNDFNLVMYEAFSYTPNPMQQNQAVTVNASVGNAGTGAFNGSFKLVLLNANNSEVQTIGQQSLSSPLPSMQYTPLTFSGTVTVPGGTYQMALYYQATSESTWTLVGNDFGVANPVSVTVTGGSTPPVNEVDLNMYADFIYTPNPLKQNTVAYISTSVINTGNTAFTGSLRLTLETNGDELVQSIQQISVSNPIAPNGYASFNFSGNITATPGAYNLTLYYKPDDGSNWTIVGTNYNPSYQNPKPVIVSAPDGIEDHTLEAAKLRPNPASDHFFLDVTDETLDRIEIVSATGQIVHTQNNVIGGESINISHLRSGVYFVRYEASGRVGIMKLVVQ